MQNKKKQSLQYITIIHPEKTILEQVNFVCNAGVKLVQLRMKESSYEDIVTTAKEVKKICDSFQAQLIINDNPMIAREVNATGVHVGQKDISPIETKKILLPHQLIGYTCNTIEQIEQASMFPIQYIGLGPFRYTTTKKDLDPILGLEGYKKIITQMQTASIHIPIVAIGGINSTEDIQSLINIGVNGVAIGSAIWKLSNPLETIHTWLRLLE